MVLYLPTLVRVVIVEVISLILTVVPKFCINSIIVYFECPLSWKNSLSHYFLLLFTWNYIWRWWIIRLCIDISNFLDFNFISWTKVLFLLFLFQYLVHQGISYHHTKEKVYKIINFLCYRSLTIINILLSTTKFDIFFLEKYPASILISYYFQLINLLLIQPK